MSTSSPRSRCTVVLLNAFGWVNGNPWFCQLFFVVPSLINLCRFNNYDDVVPVVALGVQNPGFFCHFVKNSIPEKNQYRQHNSGQKSHKNSDFWIPSPRFFYNLRLWKKLRLKLKNSEKIAKTQVSGYCSSSRAEIKKSGQKKAYENLAFFASFVIVRAANLKFLEWRYKTE